MTKNDENSKRNDILTWDETFISIAHVVKQRSKDPVTQVGACIVSSDNRILTLGYNGAPNGFDDDDFPWGKTGDEISTKYPYVVHAERNAILNFRGSLREFNNATIYVTLFPCNECAKEIIQTGIKEVVYEKMPDKRKTSTEASIIMFEKTGVKIREIGSYEI